jgi:hypothetical protein
MPSPRKLLASAILLGLTSGAVLLSAQPAPEEAEPTPDMNVPMSKEAQLTPGEMETRSTELSAQAEKDRQRIDQLKAESRKQKDIIKLNCINDKLLQVKQLLNLLDDALSRLAHAIASGDEAERYHRFTIITVSAEKINGLRGEAEACIGEEISYLGPLDIDVDEPDVVDDPTVDDPFGDGVIEPPGFASPFL